MSLAHIRKPTLIVLSLLLALVLLIAVPAPTPVYADTSVGGPIISNTTWTKAQSPYLVIANIEVWQGVTLTIEPGVVVKVQPGKLIQVGGTLIARGTASQNITFTSAKSSPAKGDWGNIRFTSTAIPTTMDAAGNYVSGSVLQYCIVEYGGAASTAAIEARSLLIDHCSVWYNATLGIYDVGTDAAPARITYNAVYYNVRAGGSSMNGAGIYTEKSTIIGNLIEGNTVSLNYSGYGTSYGGGIYAKDSTISDNGIYYNYAYGVYAYGGGINASASVITNNDVYYNTAKGRSEDAGGGGINADSNSTISGNRVVGNKVEGWHSYGGGINTGYSTVSGNTVSSNSAQNGGGGIAARFSAITNNIVSGNSAAYGGGISADSIHNYPPSTIINNTITDNSASYGGGLYAGASTVSGNVVRGNSVTFDGGGIYDFGGIYDEGSTINGNTVIGNLATRYGSGVYFSIGSLFNNTIVGNTGTSPTAIVGGLAIEGTPQVHYNNLYGNSNYDAVILSSVDVDGTNNYWGTVANVDILTHVYDWYDNTSRGRLLYIPYLQDPDPNAPVPPPMNLRGTFSGSSATLTWDPIPSTTTGYGYKIYYDSDLSGPPYQGTGLAQGNSPIDVGNATSFTLTGLAGGKYYFTVTGYDNQGHESWYSNQLIRVNKVYLPLIRR